MDWYRQQPQCDRSGVEPNARAEAERRHPHSFHVLEPSQGTRRTARRTALSQTGFDELHLFDVDRRAELSIPESWRTLSRKVSNAASIAVCLCPTSEKSGVSICSTAVLKRLLLTESIARKANACARGTPSAPACRNSMCAFTFPKTVPKPISPSVPSGIGPLTSRADPPVNERR